VSAAKDGGCEGLITGKPAPGLYGEFGIRA